MTRTVAAAVLLALLAPSPGAAAVANQPWYPEGYLDLRIAADHQVETFPRDVMGYDLVDCALGEDLPDDMNEEDRELALLALDIARLRSELAEIGYPPEVYDQPLLDYERWYLSDFPPSWAEHLFELIAKYPDGPPEDFYEVERSLEEYAEMDILNSGMLGALGEELERRRKLLSPRKPRFYVEGGCGAGEAEFEIKLEPANGELWLINAFAFRVCERKVADPWDHRVCGWTQYQQGDTTFASGRYMYEARWGSTVRRGARVLQGDLEENEGGVITFRRN